MIGAECTDFLLSGRPRAARVLKTGGWTHASHDVDQLIDALEAIASPALLTPSEDMRSSSSGSATSPSAGGRNGMPFSAAVSQGHWDSSFPAVTPSSLGPAMFGPPQVYNPVTAPPTTAGHPSSQGQQPLSTSAQQQVPSWLFATAATATSATDTHDSNHATSVPTVPPPPTSVEPDMLIDAGFSLSSSAAANPLVDQSGMMFGGAGWATGIAGEGTLFGDLAAFGLPDLGDVHHHHHHQHGGGSGSRAADPVTVPGGAVGGARAGEREPANEWASRSPGTL